MVKLKCGLVAFPPARYAFAAEIFNRGRFCPISPDFGIA
jgi:hypothetical protein